MTARVASTPLARKLARLAGVTLAQLRGSGPGGRVVAADVSGQPVAGRHRPLPQAEEGVRAATARIKSTPYARRLARSRAIDLGRVRGSGPNGRIVARDLALSVTVTTVIATEAASALCAQLNRTLARDAPPIMLADIAAAAVARATRGDVAWTVDGIRPTWSIPAGARLAEIAQARTAGTVHDARHVILLRAAISSGRTTLTVSFPQGENRGDAAALAARIRETIAWPIGLLL